MINKEISLICPQTQTPDIWSPYFVLSLQIRVEVYDNGQPSLNDISIVKVSVNRNLNPPRFTEGNGNQEVSILYSQVLGSPIAVVEASDADAQAPHNEVEYYLIGDALAQQYFMVNRQTGEVSVRKDLGDDRNTRYSVSTTPQQF